MPQMAAPAFYQQEPDVIKNTQADFARLESELKEAYARWEKLESLQG